MIVQPTKNPLVIITKTLSATDLSQAIFTADAGYVVSNISVVWGVAGGAAAVLNVEKLTGTTAPGGGTTMQGGTVDLTATANTVTTPALTATASVLQLASGDRIGIKLAGVLTGLLGCVVTITMRTL